MFWKEKSFWFWIILALIIGGFFGFVSCSWDVFSLMFTATVLTWYSVETMKLRKNSFAANQITLHPGLTMRYMRSEKNHLDSVFILTNQGKGVALNPEIQVLNQPLPSFGDLIFKVNGVNAIHPSDTIEVEWELGGRKNDQALLAMFAENNFRVKIKFYSALDLEQQLSTELKISSPPESKITKTKWI